MQFSLSPNKRQSPKIPKDVSKESIQRKPQAQIVRRNIEDFLEKEVLERRLSEVFNISNINRLS
jgi:hypothetical protein